MSLGNRPSGCFRKEYFIVSTLRFAVLAFTQTYPMKLFNFTSDFAVYILIYTLISLISFYNIQVVIKINESRRYAPRKGFLAY